MVLMRLWSGGGIELPPPPPPPPAAGGGKPAVSQSRRLREMLLDQGAELDARHPDMLTGGWRQRIPLVALCTGAIGIYVMGLVTLDISPPKILSGLGRLLDIAGLMLPPDPETWSRFLL